MGFKKKDESDYFTRYKIRAVTKRDMQIHYLEWISHINSLLVAQPPSVRIILVVLWLFREFKLVNIEASFWREG